MGNRNLEREKQEPLVVIDKRITTIVGTFRECAKKVNFELFELVNPENYFSPREEERAQEQLTRLGMAELYVPEGDDRALCPVKEEWHRYNGLTPEDSRNAMREYMKYLNLVAQSLGILKTDQNFSEFYRNSQGVQDVTEIDGFSQSKGHRTYYSLLEKIMQERPGVILGNSMPRMPRSFQGELCEFRNIPTNLVGVTARTDNNRYFELKDESFITQLGDGRAGISLILTVEQI